MKVVKTIKMFIGGKFERSESGRSYSENKKNSEELFARLCLASKKDFRNAVEVALAAGSGWKNRTAFNRSQILYRMAEMVEGKRTEFLSVMQEVCGLTLKQAEMDFAQAVDNIVYYAGFCDKYQQVSGTVNPINGPFHSFTTPTAVGMVTIASEKEIHFSKLLALISSVICSGNTLIVVLTHAGSLLAPLSEVLATSDLPSGVVNLLTGHLEELLEVISSHREVRSVYLEGASDEVLKRLQQEACENMKRVVAPIAHDRHIDNILKFVEYKSVWHPIGQ